MYPFRTLGPLAAILASLFVLSGCSLVSNELGGEQEENADQADPAHTIDSRPANSWATPGGRAEVSLHRVDDEHMVAQRILTKEGDSAIPVMDLMSSFLSDEYQESDEEMFSGIGWLDPGGRVPHKPYQRCQPLGERRHVGGYPGLQAPPEGVEELTIVTNIAPPFVNVPVQQGAPEGLEYAAPEDEPDAEPQPAELESVIDSEEETVIEDSETTDIDLSTDVLFEVEESGAAEVAIEGHAESIGNDGINDPLSQDRADVVRDWLEELLAADIEYTTEGFGSEEPIASNDSEESRQKNRRVTISAPRQRTRTLRTGRTRGRTNRSRARARPRARRASPGRPATPRSTATSARSRWTSPTCAP